MTAIEQMVTDKIAAWATASKPKVSTGKGASSGVEQYGVIKLRSLIYELAVRGNLVPQASCERAADSLLKQMAKEKADLIASKKIRKRRASQPVSPEEYPFNLPSGWVFARLDAIGDWGAGATPSRRGSGLYGGDIPWFKSGELESDWIFQSEECVTAKALETCSLRLNEPGDVAVAMYGATIGKASILGVQSTTNQAVCACKVFGEFKNTFLLLLLKAYKERFVQMGAGGAQPNISREKIVSVVVPVPSAEEQQRIVAKVEELMLLCDQLETQQADSIEAHKRLVTTLLDALTKATEQEGFDSAWARIAEHFDALFTTEWSVNRLQQTIIQIAVQGSLIPQNSSDNSVSSMLTRLAMEKAALVESGKIKAEKKLLPIESEELPFALPMGWQWARAEQLFLTIVDCPHSTPKFQDEGLLCLDTNSFKSGQLIENKFRYVSAETYEARNARLVPQAGDIVFAREGSVGESVVIPEGVECCLGQRVMLFRPPLGLHSEFFRMALSSPEALTRLLDLHKGIGAKHVNVGDMRNFILAVPPLDEQREIVVKVYELMAICDALKSAIQEAQQTQLLLADAITEQAVA